MTAKKPPPSARPKAGKVELATRRSLRKLKGTTAATAELWDALEAQAVLLAQTLDAGAGLATAGISKELGRVLAELAAHRIGPVGGGHGDDPFDDFDGALARPVVVSAPVGDAA